MLLPSYRSISSVKLAACCAADGVASARDVWAAPVGWVPPVVLVQPASRPALRVRVSARVTCCFISRSIHGYHNDTLPGSPKPREVHKAFLDAWLRWLRAGSKRNEDGTPKLTKRAGTGKAEQKGVGAA